MLIGIIIGLVVLIFLVVIHELGHAVVAKRNGVDVKEFAVGFPPNIYKNKVKNSFIGKDVVFKINLLPLGGYVRLKGEYDASKAENGYGNASYWVKTKILFAGVFVNWVFAAIVFALLSLHGIPKLFDNQFHVASDTQVVQTREPEVLIMGVVDDSIAEEAGFKAGDKVLAVEGEKVTDADQLVKSIGSRGEEGLKVKVEREGDAVSVAIPGIDENSDQTTVGVSIGGVAGQETLRSTWSAPIVGVGFAAQLTVETLKGLGQMIGDFVTGIFTSDEAKPEEATSAQGVVGPVGILGEIFPNASRAGIGAIAFLAGVISLSLAIMNTLPIPGLDGGRWLTMTAFRLSKKELTREREETIQGIGVLLILALVISVTVADIGRMF